MSTSLPHLLLHICCAPCSTWPLVSLEDKYDVTAFFYNPNIHPKEEYALRMEEAVAYLEGRTGLQVEEPDVERWLELTRGLENEPEKGARCTICYEMRLRRTAEYAAKHSFDAFAAVLSVSPHKDAARVNEVGERLAGEYGVKYLPTDWKKCDGTRKGVELARQANLRRQNYCGCVYSLRERLDKIKKREQAVKKQGSDGQ